MFAAAPPAPTPALQPLDVERSDRDVIAVTVAWLRDPIFVAHVRLGERFVVSADAGSDFCIPADHGSAVIEYGGDGPVLRTEGTIASITSLEGAMRRGQGSLPLQVGEQSVVPLGPLTVTVGVTPAGKPTPRKALGSERRVAGFFSGALMMVASFVGAMAMYAPPLGLLDDTDAQRERLYLLQQYLDSAAERERELAPSDADTGATSSDAPAAQAADGPAGQLGKPETVTREPKRYSTIGASESPVVQMRREDMVKAATEFGMIGLLSSYVPEGLAAPWADGGRGDVVAMGTMFGDEIGDAFGTAGLSLSGLGNGGGDRGEWVALVRGNCLGGNCPGTGGFYPGPRAAKFGVHKTITPHIRPESPETVGMLASTLIQRVVRQNFGRFRSCYEQGLSRNPGLEGRVTARFVIARDGSVASVQNGGADLPDPGVVSCILTAYRSLSFPAPENGIVTVSYPIVFSPAA